jgi:hypothetical protein
VDRDAGLDQRCGDDAQQLLTTPVVEHVVAAGPLIPSGEELLGEAFISLVGERSGTERRARCCIEDSCGERAPATGGNVDEVAADRRQQKVRHVAAQRRPFGEFRQIDQLVAIGVNGRDEWNEDVVQMQVAVRAPEVHEHRVVVAAGEPHERVR